MAKRKKRRKPKVRIDEISSGARPIEGVGTTIAAFIGLAPASPIRLATTAVVLVAAVAVIRRRAAG